MAKRIMREFRWAQRFEDDLISHALKTYVTMSNPESIRNLEALFTTVMRRRMIDIKRNQGVQNRRLGVLGRMYDDDLFLEHDDEVVRLSDQVANRDLEKLGKLKVRAALACIVNEEERRIIEHFLFAPSTPTLAELGELYGGKSAPAIASILRKYFGHGSHAGALQVPFDVVGKMSFGTARAFVKVLETSNPLNRSGDLFKEASDYLAGAAKTALDNREQAKIARARLRWLEAHLPNERGLLNKTLRRVIFAACEYVVESDDAKPDRHHPRGLNDDVEVLRCVAEVVRSYAAK